MSDTKRLNTTKVITGKHTVFSYLNANEPKAPLGGGTPVYSASLIIPKSDTVTVQKIKAAIKEAYAEGEAKLKGSSRTVPALEDIHTPLRDGDKDRPDDANYANSFFVNAKSRQKPGAVDADRNPILESSELYSGIIGRASISFFAYNKNGNKGIGCGLNNIQKLSDGTPLGGRSRAEDDFAGLDDDEDDFLN